METVAEGSNLKFETWENLVKLTSPHVTADKLNTILSDILHVKSFKTLSEEQAIELLKALGSLPGLKSLLWENGVRALEEAQEHIDKALEGLPNRVLARVDAPAAIEAVVQAQLDALALSLIKNNVNLALFEPVEPNNVD